VGPGSHLNDKRPRRQRRFAGKLQLETLEARVVPTTGTFTLPLVDQTGLDPSQYSIYVLGFSAASQMELQSNGQFASFPASSGTIPSYNIHSMPSITLDTTTALTGARLYFFVVPEGQAAPTMAYSNNGSSVTQPLNPPNNSNPYDIVEITQPANGEPTVDVQTVDGFIFPLTLTLNDNLGQVGQPLANPNINRQDIISTYTTFMNGQGAAGLPYQALVFAPNSVAGQAGGIVNPGLYLAAGANPSSDLNTVWDADLTTLFQTPGRTLSMIGDDGDYYVGTPTQLSPGGPWGLHFVGYTDQNQNTQNGNVFNIYSPLTPDPAGSYQTNETSGEMVFANDGVFNDISGNVLIATNGSVGPTPQQVALGLQRDIVSALNRGVALLGPTDGLNGDASTYWGTETNWYPAGQTANLFSMFMHTATINGTPLFVLPSGAVADAQGALMASAYGFGFDETPGHGPANQPNVPSKFDPVPAGTISATITLGPWFPPVPAAPPSTPSSSAGPTGPTAVLFLAEDQFALLVDSVMSRFSNDPLFTQAADRAISLLNNLLHLNNPALYTGLSGLQSAIDANPYDGTAWGLLGEAIGMELATNWFQPLSHG
jgi:hypothetical protein